jgi:single-strand DNA-binding protein
MYNRTVLVGRITDHLKLSKTPNGSSTTNFTLALDRGYSNNGKKEVDYPVCVAWNKIAENVCKYCSKGSLVLVEGKIQTRNYENKDKQKVYVTEVYCDSVKFIDTKRREESAQNVSLEKQFDEQYDSFDIKEDDLAF